MGKYKKIAGVYVISNILNDKKYIGSSKNIRKRWDNHKNHLRKNAHENKHLQSAWNKYGEKNFIFYIIEQMPLGLTKSEYEEVETKWVLYFKTHLSEYGYNSCLPGSIPLCKEGENITQRSPLPTYICINMKTGEIVSILGREDVSTHTGIPLNKITDVASYWKGKGKRKSLHGWVIVREEDYDVEFDYIRYKKGKPSKYGRKLSQQEYYQMRKAEGKIRHKQYKKKEEVIPYNERHLKKVPIVAINISTGEEIHYRCISDSEDRFMLSKVRKCINSPFGKYKHRGYYFRKDEGEGKD